MNRKVFIIYIFVLGLLAGTTAQAQLAMPSTSNEGIEAQVEAYFADAPEMAAIAKCESGFRQFNSSGQPLAGGTGGSYIGIFQISKGHVPEAISMGWDIYTTQGNLAYAKYLYQKLGTEPWSGCVTLPVATAAVQPSTTPIITPPILQPPLLTATTTSQTSLQVPTALSLNLQIGMVSPEVIILQQLLNEQGFNVALSGAGSAGNETSKFGALTKAAVERFQCTKNITCSGSESTTGFGRVGPITRAALLLAH